MKKNNQSKKKSYTKIALTLSACLMIVWGILGTGTSLAWFTDTTPVQKNIFNIGELKMIVSHKLEDGTYEEVTSETAIFDDEALYEPGYVQVVYLKVANQGDFNFDYKLAVTVNDVEIVPGVLGNEIYLPNYLKFGVLFGADEAELDREVAKALSTEEFPDHTGEYPLNTYSEKDDETVEVGGTRYIAIIVRMPEEVGNAANYRGDQPPVVKMGITVNASQEGTLS